MIDYNKTPTPRYEPEGAIFLNKFTECRRLFEKASWVVMCERFHEYNRNVTSLIAKSFNGKYAQIGSLDLPVSELCIANCTGLPCDVEHWFKGKSILEYNCTILPCDEERWFCCIGLEPYSRK